MKHPEAIEKLFEIIEIPDRETVLLKTEDRKKALHDWVNTYVASIEETQLTIAAKKVTMDNHDFICEKIAHDCIDALMESKLIEFTVAENSYTASMWGLRSLKALKFINKKV